MTAPAIRDLHFTPASRADREGGLLGWLSCRYHDVVLDGLTLRRTLDGHLVISFPERRDRAGRGHPIVRPVDAEARAAITAAVLQGLNLGQEARR